MSSPEEIPLVGRVLQDVCRENRELQTRVLELEQRLRLAPMPFAESTLDGEDWDEAYSDWWHASASEASLGEEKNGDPEKAD